ncbi:MULTISPECIES: PucR family transcriptional regulator [Streptomyces]|uniref:PucR family transcriptional regulator n=1 Tax=Streptomyces scabiei TaxID=1930 RepID=UPI0004E71EF5|nr:MULTISPECIES: PucR family transcriptional regulator ligand-binding domain-containing protein [Streptomyces]MBP5865241.1 PucR family transcriptional regulator [Streptomyces sp. LBUM 1484]KFG05499.1 PucR family transcriptional regulator [Streptomyces scabiei]MBP5874070.1 PucR family transcriptional regulator [Streptomyces sp. LBUM 1477]MBP5881794.1 PucR family transcriptional regulator [Streptomyces sp. LBUM 1487]MBP5897568.1 PucR family transcriptional regulator [Streptomyces sp. LBUM 1488]
MNDNHPAGQGPTRPLTVADVLALPVLAAGLPRVVTGMPGLDRPVRWVHITELTDPASFLKGGELVLTTGMPLPQDTAGVRRYVDELADVGAAALVIELVRRYHRPPDALVDACRRRGLPLVTLAEDVNFLEVTQVVHALLLGNQTEAMRRTQRIHEAFTTLTLRGAGPEDVVRAAAEMSGRTVVLENLVHRALLCEPSGLTVEEALADWERRSRATGAGDSTAVSGPEGWLTASVAYQGERWGRVAMLPARTEGAAFGPEEITLLERTAMALTVARLIHPAPWERTAHRNALRDLVEQRHRSAGDARARCSALGLPADRSHFVATLVDVPAGEGVTGIESRLSQELSRAGATALVGELAPDRLGILLALRASRTWRPLVEQLSASVLGVVPEAVVSVGSEVTDLTETARSFREADRVAEATPPRQPLPTDRSFHELSDIGLRRLLYAVREDARIQEYTERQLRRLVDHDTQHGTDLLTTLRHYLDAAGNKTTAARRGGLSRETMYQRLRTIERLLGRDLESGDQRTELHVALTALDVLRSG